jgi:hypothetical protein
MRRKWLVLLVGTTLLGMLAAGISLASASSRTAHTNPWGLPMAGTARTAAPNITTGRTLVVISRGGTETDVDEPPAGFSQGDEGTVGTPLFNRAGAKVGHLDVQFVISFAARENSRIQVTFTSSLTGMGEITATGAANFDSSEATAAVTGGTGRFQNARGEVHISFGQNAVVLTYHLIP